MNPILIDPNNHAPDVSPDDGWDDAEGFGAEDRVTGTVLPPRRPLTERAAAAPGEPAGAGLRIESNVARRDADDESPGLQVQEISGSVIRLEQSSEGPPKVARQLVFHERAPSGKKSAGEGRDWGLAHRFSTRWIVLIGTGVTSVIILSMIMLPNINKANAARPTATDRDLKVIDMEKVDGMDAVNAMLTMQHDAEQIYRIYVSSTVADEVLPWLVDAEASEDEFRKSWSPSQLATGWSPPPDTLWQVMKSRDKPYGLLEGTLPDFSKFSACFVTQNQKLLLDWKATVAYGTATFEELSQKKGNPSEIRGLLSEANFYTTTWPEEEYQSYQLLAPVGELSVWCYARRTEAVGGACADLLRTGEILNEAKGSKKITVRLGHGPAGALPNQWSIDEVIHADWLTR